MSKQARALALLVIENAELRAWVDRAKEAAPVERAHIRKEYAVMAEALEADLEEAHKRIAELESRDQHYAGELRTFFEGVRALIGAEEMKDDCSSVLQELGRHTSDSLHTSARAVLDALRAEYASDPDKDPALRWLTLGHKLYPWFEAGFPGTSREERDGQTASVNGWDALRAIPGVYELHSDSPVWQLAIEPGVYLEPIQPLLEKRVKQHPSLPQLWTRSSQDHCYYGRDPVGDEKPGVYLA